MLDLIRDWFAESETRPNKFTVFMGDRIRQAREEAGFTQEKLAQLVYLRRATLSDIENGKSEASASVFVHIAYSTNKPLAFFLPEFMYNEIKQEDLSPEENELITNYRYHIASDHLGKVVIDIIKAIGKFDIDSFVVEQAPITKANLEKAKELEKLHKKK